MRYLFIKHTPPLVCSYNKAEQEGQLKLIVSYIPIGSVGEAIFVNEPEESLEFVAPVHVHHPILLETHENVGLDLVESERDRHHMTGKPSGKVGRNRLLKISNVNPSVGNDPIENLRNSIADLLVVEVEPFDLLGNDWADPMDVFDDLPVFDVHIPSLAVVECFTGPEQLGRGRVFKFRLHPIPSRDTLLIFFGHIIFSG